MSGVRMRCRQALSVTQWAQESLEQMGQVMPMSPLPQHAVAGTWVGGAAGRGAMTSSVITLGLPEQKPPGTVLPQKGPGRRAETGWSEHAGHGKAVVMLAR